MAMKFDPTGSVLICGEGNFARGFSPGPGQVVFCDLKPFSPEPRVIDAHPSQTNSLAIDPTGLLLISGGDERTLTFWNLNE